MKKSKLLNPILLALITGIVFYGCSQEDESIAPTVMNNSSEFHSPVIESEAGDMTIAASSDNLGGCQAEMRSIGSVSLGSIPKLAPVTHGMADFENKNECDYFVGFPDNNYTKIYVYDAGDSYTAGLIRSLITNRFNGYLGRARNTNDYFDQRIFIIFGNVRTYDSLKIIASLRGLTISQLLYKHLRMAQ